MSLPADFSTCPAQRRRHPSTLRPEDGPDLRGVLHDVGHGLFTLSLLLSQASGEVRSRLGADAFELVDDEISRLLAVVHTGTRRSGDLVPVDVRSVLQPFAAVSHRTSLTKVSVRPGPSAVVHTDPATLWRVIANLLDNAVRAAGPLGTVEIVVNHSGPNTVTIDVCDDGPGFQQGPPGVAQLGLTVVTRLLDACGGRLQIDDVAPHGTRMRVVLPIVASAAPVAVERTDAFLSSGMYAS